VTTEPDGQVGPEEPDTIEALIEQIRARGPLDAFDEDTRRRMVIRLMHQYREASEAIANESRWMQAAVAEFNQRTAKLSDWQNELDEMIGRLARPLAPKDKKFVDVPGLGRISWREQKEYVRVADADTFIAWARQAERTDLYETETVYKPLTKFIKEEGLALIRATRAELVKEGDPDAAEDADLDLYPGLELVPTVENHTIKV